MRRLWLVWMATFGACNPPGDEHEFDLTVYPLEPVIGEALTYSIRDRCAVASECHEDTFEILSIRTSGAAVLREAPLAPGESAPYAAGYPGAATLTVSARASDAYFSFSQTADLQVVLPDDVQGRVSCTGPGDLIPAENELSVSYTMFLDGVQRSGRYDTTPITGPGFELVRETGNNAVLRIPASLGPTMLSVTTGSWTRALEIYDPADAQVVASGALGNFDARLNRYDLTLDLAYDPTLTASACTLPGGRTSSLTPAVCETVGKNVFALESGQCTVGYTLIGDDVTHSFDVAVTSVAPAERPWDATCMQADGRICGVVCDVGGGTSGDGCTYGPPSVDADCTLATGMAMCVYPLDAAASPSGCSTYVIGAPLAMPGTAACWMP